MNSITRLKALYAKNSKHSNYQILSDKLTTIIGNGQIEVRSRYERERLDYILRNIPIEGKSILDVGGNSGFFTFEAIERGAKKVHYYEGNTAHSEFVKAASEVLEFADNIEITNGYYVFKSEYTRKYDAVFLLNVLHHLGDDYGDRTLSIDAAKELMVAQLNNMAMKTSHLAFQLGFCWKGNRDLSLFRNGTKKELIEFIESGTRDSWSIQNVGIAETSNDGIIYKHLSSINIQRQDSLGEFLNRPLFIMQSKL